MTEALDTTAVTLTTPTRPPGTGSIARVYSPRAPASPPQELLAPGAADPAPVCLAGWAQLLQGRLDDAAASFRAALGASPPCRPLGDGLDGGRALAVAGLGLVAARRGAATGLGACAAAIFPAGAAAGGDDGSGAVAERTVHHAVPHWMGRAWLRGVVST